MLSKATAFLEHAYEVLNVLYFEGNLPKVVLSIQSTPKAYGHVTVDKIWNGSGEKYRELNIGAEYLNRDIENLLATIVHEQVHIYAMENGIADTSKGGKYHNKVFKKLCEERDLQIEYVKYIGYSKTTPTAAFVEKMKANGLYIGNFDNYRMTGRGDKGGGDKSGGDTAGGKTKTGKKNYVRKYQCLGCNKSTRSTTDMNLLCLDCGLVMVHVNGNNEDL